MEQPVPKTRHGKKTKMDKKLPPGKVVLYYNNINNTILPILIITILILIAKVITITIIITVILLLIIKIVIFIIAIIQN